MFVFFVVFVYLFVSLFVLLIAALIFSAGYYSAPIFFYNSKNLNCIGALCFLQFKEFELYWGAVFLRLEEEYWRSPFFFLINFIGVNFEAGNETREKIWSDLVAEQSEERSEKRVVFCSYSCF